MKTLRELREERGLSPVDVAAALKVSLASIYNWESGKHEPRVSQLRKLAEFFGVSTDEIVLERDFIKKAIGRSDRPIAAEAPRPLQG